jgi:precorrin-3B methylase
MSDTPVKVVVDCSATGAPDPALAAEFQKAALAVLQNVGTGPGDMDRALERAGKIMQDANDILTAATAPTETIVPLTAEELKQRDADQAAAAEQAKADQAAADARATLTAKLAKGAATDAEVQQALAQLLR